MLYTVTTTTLIIPGNNFGFHHLERIATAVSHGINLCYFRGIWGVLYDFGADRSTVY